MYHFHVSVHVRPSWAEAGSEVKLDSRRLQSLAVDSAQLAATSFESTFEETYARLETLPRMFIEPDGSWVWSGVSGEVAWQVDGHLYDRAERLLYVELKGSCPPEQFDRLLEALGWPKVTLAFQLQREAIVLDEDEFRRYAVHT